MILLATDTSTAAGSVALLEDGSLTAEWTLHSAQTHNRRLLKTVDMLLGEAGLDLESVDGFASTVGPGSFTGLRIGLTTMKTLAWVLQKAYAGIPSLDALAAPLGFASEPVCALIDARKKEVYCALYQPDGRGGFRLEEPYSVLSPEAVTRIIRRPTVFCGDGLLHYGDLLREKLGDKVIEASGPYHTIRASFVGELAFRRFSRGDFDEPMTSVPLYVRPSEAELKHPEMASRYLR
jgi:tRNA threonylcarbamoyladenosine biosynthesis protein TsaB